MEDYKKIIEQMVADGAISQEAVKKYCPELKKNRDEKIRKALITVLKSDFEADTTIYDISVGEIINWLEKLSKEEPVNFNEAEKEKSDFVGNKFIECHANFLDFKKGDTYWLEYIGDDKYNVRSDNLLGKTYHITPCQLYTVFKNLTWLEKQAEQKPAVKPLKGNWYVCIKDYQFCEHDYLTFEKGKIYKSVKDGEIMAEDGGNWPFSDAKDYFRIASQEEINSMITTDKTEPKFKAGDKLISTRNQDLTYEVLEVGHINELGALDYKVRIFDKSGSSRDCYLRCDKVDEWAKLIELKSTDKVEPKFKTGDWVAINNHEIGLHSPLHIVDLNETQYRVEDVNGNSGCPKIEYLENHYHLWNIATDARDGDILSNGEIIVIFKHFENPSYRQLIIAYIGLDTIGNIQVVDDIWNLGVDKAKPATKEQRDQLKKAMADAGYTFDFEKKKLKEIHVIDEDKAEIDDCFTKMMNGEKVSHIWSDDDERMFKNTIDLIEIIENSRKIPDGFGDVKSWLKAFKDKIQLQQSHQEWNEEDKKIYSRIYDLIHDAAFANYDVDEDGKELGEYAKITNWFKALKDRAQSQSYDPYKAVVESIAEMCQHYDRKDVMSLQDFYDNVKVKCKDAKEYESLFPRHF